MKISFLSNRHIYFLEAHLCLFLWQITMIKNFEIGKAINLTKGKGLRIVAIVHLVLEFLQTSEVLEE